MLRLTDTRGSRLCPAFFHASRYASIRRLAPFAMSTTSSRGRKAPTVITTLIHTITASASGFLDAEGSATIAGGSTSTKPNITLLSGDIDGNGVIDQFDALTIGMSYNTATPSEADLNNDGVINVLDLELLASNYRETAPQEWN